ncbi:Flagellar assembly protein T, middle domain [Andreprevotia lacus DSM 23236]|jgi:hypothetical protein|uniref:Flagellar assembly protein T, middle domain n=1 Tax=Andreprevotia lacus DSM 23236 TaxID=1121001 RepID=A0A1W1XYE6_9NEIS|nr:flagella assembly protein FlgT middle domain-containing protein [Andreprevotia lacus]SMC28581.1 Flagellar assembly protein T, middle domain [Andreprevotia lacus DSM 23236]
MKLGLAALLLGAVLWAGAVQAAPVLGAAPYAGDVNAARDAAINDALQNAALFNGAMVTATGRSDAGRNAESQQVRPQQPGPGSYTLLREWREGTMYFVQIEPGMGQPAKAAPMPAPVEAAAEPAAVNVASGGKAQCAGAAYKRKVLVTPFWLTRPAQANDLADPGNGFQHVLADRLGNGGRFLTYLGADELAFAPQPGVIDPQLRPEQVRQLARRYGVQFIIGGLVHDLSTSGVKYRPVYGQEIRPEERKITFALPLLGWLGAGVKSMPKARQVDMEVYLFDGVSGALVSRHRGQQVASGQVMARPDQAVDSAGFAQGDLGQTVGSVLDQLAQQVSGDVACIPFSARIVRVEGRRLYFDAGTVSGIAPGDVLQLYRLRAGQDLQALSALDAQGQGLVEDLAGSVRVEQVQPLFATALAEGSQPEIGDYVRFVSTGKMR